MVIKVNSSYSSEEDKLQVPFSLNTILLIKHIKICCFLIQCIDVPVYQGF